MGFFQRAKAYFGVIPPRRVDLAASDTSITLLDTDSVLILNPTGASPDIATINSRTIEPGRVLVLMHIGGSANAVNLIAGNDPFQIGYAGNLTLINKTARVLIQDVSGLWMPDQGKTSV